MKYINGHSFSKARCKKIINASFALCISHLVSTNLLAQEHLRAGDPLPGLTPQEFAYFQRGKNTFEEINEVGIRHRIRKSQEPDGGLGPRFNSNSCVSCHARPAVGGSSPETNPQIAIATRFGAKNKIPSFIKLDGPVMEVRFKSHADGTPDGTVHGLFVITGRFDAGNCNIAQPDFDSQMQNLAFRIPTPLFGAGLIQEITDTTILTNKNENAAAKAALGIFGHENRDPHDGTISRFGWKAQNKSLLIFSGEAYNVEQGVTNELFPTKKDETPECIFSGLPEDHVEYEATDPVEAMSDTSAFAQFARFLAPITPKSPTPDSQRGADLFSTTGCAMCHTPSMKTGRSSSAALDQKDVNLYSDLLVHHMGSRLADGITQGKAGPDEFRTAPLWGVGQRKFFMHDGRARSYTDAVRAHAGPNSEANIVVDKFNQLTPTQKGDLVKFLGSL